MTPPLPPPGYELVEDEPREFDMAWVGAGWGVVDKDLDVAIHDVYIGVRCLRWIARKIENP